MGIRTWITKKIKGEEKKLSENSIESLKPLEDKKEHMVKPKIKRTPWKIEDERKLTRLVENSHSNIQIAGIMGRSVDSIRTRIYERKNKSGSYISPVAGYNAIHQKALKKALSKSHKEKKIHKSEMRSRISPEANMGRIHTTSINEFAEPKKTIEYKEESIIKKKHEVIEEIQFGSNINNKPFTHMAYRDICLILNLYPHTEAGYVSTKVTKKQKISKELLLERIRNNPKSFSDFEWNNISVYLAENNIDVNNVK